MRSRYLFTTALAVLTLLPVPAFAQEAADAASTEAGGDIVVTGSRGQPRTVTSSPTPIDVIDGEQLSRLSGSLQLRDVLTQLVPSFQAQQVGSSSFDSVARPAGLRGLSGVHVLVLVNGKRRHNSALINLNSGNVSAGGNPVDLDQIPASAIERIEVLRDGAAAQYGSDAIAGVINVILKKNATGGSLSMEVGQRYRDEVNGSDGETATLQASHGFALGERGSLTVSVDGKYQNATVRNSDTPGNFYFPVNGQPDPREATVNRRNYQGGLPQLRQVQGALNGQYDLGNVTAYMSTTLGYREARVGQAGRKPNTTSNVIAIYPDGFTPYYTLQETDFQSTAGLKGSVGLWSVDLSTTYGRDYARSGADNSINASLGALSPTTFNTFSAAFDQWTNNLDVTRSYKIFGRNLQISAGAEYRYESYVTKALDRAAYQNGGYVYPAGIPLAGQPGAVGAQGAVIVTPADQADIKRNVWAGYADLALDVTDRFLVTGAVRYETYDDSSGDVWSGKVSTRYKVFDWLNVRGAFSTGFRAPSLAQQAYAQTSTQFNLVGGAYQLIESKIVRSGSPIANALGAAPLKPERSRNYSVGLALTPLTGLSVTVDAYQIDLDDRITLTGLLSNAGVRAILRQNGFSGDQYVRFFTNAIDTRTRGIDVVGSYNIGLGNLGRLRATVGYNHNETRIRAIAPTPSQLAGLNLTLFDRQTQGYFTVGTPEDKLILGADWTLGRFGLNVKETRYGKWASLNNTPSLDQFYGAKWITDVEAGFDVTDSARVAVGAYNVFDTYPDKNTVPNTIGSSIYGSNSPFGAYGGYYYARLSLKL
ncbi:TonB-dependent receptor [Sphingomonas sp. BK235]|uniref:TonB-dependent receptor plug domain-containing protein n=1 Tax=Sphingomonas sp. BK235 TaxID=2512131 RepID=UPI00104C4D0C|nr:TonB-dependent receptor [Sphingomonas sp. BK235]TCP30353.1 iron complex outermembrane receptor protein [Sphingomonas sp. BK235]